MKARLVVPLAERPGVSADLAFIFATWLKGARAAFSEMRDTDYFDRQHDRIERLLLGPGRVTVLHPEGTPAVIAAWAMYDEAPDVLHYVHVRGEYRGQGHGTRLAKGRQLCTHLTEQGERLKRRLGIRYVPHLLDGLT